MVSFRPETAAPHGLILEPCGSFRPAPSCALHFKRGDDLAQRLATGALGLGPVAQRTAQLMRLLRNLGRILRKKAVLIRYDPRDTQLCLGKPRDQPLVQTCQEWIGTQPVKLRFKFHLIQTGRRQPVAPRILS